MTKKHKFIDKLKSWLVTLGIASVFGLAALGVNASQTYTKTSAYTYQDNGTLVFNLGLGENVEYTDFNLLYNYCLNGDIYDGTYHYINTWFVLDDDNTASYIACRLSSSGNKYLIFGTGEYTDLNSDSNFYSLSLINGVVEEDDNFIDDFTFNDSVYTTNSLSGYFHILNYALSYNAPQSEGNFLSALTSFMQLLGGAIVQLAQPVANGITEFARDLFIDNNSLSIVGGVIGIFAGIALAVGITTKVYQWVTSLGN